MSPSATLFVAIWSNIVHPVPLDIFRETIQMLHKRRCILPCQRVMSRPVFSGFSWESARFKKRQQQHMSYKLRHEIDINSLGCFLKWWVFPPNHPWINRGFPLFSPSILGYHYFWKHPLKKQFILAKKQTFRTVWTTPKKTRQGIESGCL